MPGPVIRRYRTATPVRNVTPSRANRIGAIASHAVILVVWVGPVRMITSVKVDSVTHHPAAKTSPAKRKKFVSWACARPSVAPKTSHAPQTLSASPMVRVLTAKQIQAVSPVASHNLAAVAPFVCQGLVAPAPRLTALITARRALAPTATSSATPSTSDSMV